MRGLIEPVLAPLLEYIAALQGQVTALTSQVETLQARVVELEAANADLRAQLQVKQERIAQLERQVYGRKSERTQVSDPKRAVHRGPLRRRGRGARARRGRGRHAHRRRARRGSAQRRLARAALRRLPRPVRGPPPRHREARYLGPEAPPSPYARAPERPAGAWDGARFVRLLAPVAVEDCAGHFGGLPALPVSILGRHVLGAVVDGLSAAGGDPEGVYVRRAELVTE